MEKYLEPDRSQMTTWGLCLACWIPKVYVILIVFHCYNGCTTAPQYCVTRTLSVCPVIFYVTDRRTDGRKDGYK